MVVPKLYCLYSGLSSYNDAMIRQWENRVAICRVTTHAYSFSGRSLWNMLHVHRNQHEADKAKITLRDSRNMESGSGDEY